MSTIKIRQNNSQKFLDDIKRVTEVMVFANETKDFFITTKKAVRRIAEEEKIEYYITDSIFKVKRDVMVII